MSSQSNESCIGRKTQKIDVSVGFPWPHLCHSNGHQHDVSTQIWVKRFAKYLAYELLYRPDSWWECAFSFLMMWQWKHRIWGICHTSYKVNLKFMGGGEGLLAFVMTSSQPKKFASIMCTIAWSLLSLLNLQKASLFSSPTTIVRQLLILTRWTYWTMYWAGFKVLTPPPSPPLAILAGDFNCRDIDWSTQNLTPGIAQARNQALSDLSDKYGLIWLCRRAPPPAEH